MAAATANQTLHGFIYYLKHNPVKSIEAGMTHADLDAMVTLYVAANASDATLTSDPLSYGATQDFPKKGGGDGTGVAATTPSMAVCDQALYPDQHFGS